MVSVPQLILLIIKAGVAVGGFWRLLCNNDDVLCAWLYPYHRLLPLAKAQRKAKAAINFSLAIASPLSPGQFISYNARKEYLRLRSAGDLISNWFIKAEVAVGGGSPMTTHDSPLTTYAALSEPPPLPSASVPWPVAAQDSDT